MNVEEKKIAEEKKSFSAFEGAPFKPFEYTRTFFRKMIFF